MVDLHVHSTRSDGTYTPRELVDYAMEKGLDAFALTDHDTVDGLDEAMGYAEALRKNQVNDVLSAPSAETDSSAKTDSHTALSSSAGTNSHATADSSFKSGSRHIPEVVPGIEFSTEYQRRDIHIVGLYIDYKNKDFTQYLQDFIDSRTLRNQKMCKLLANAGIDISYERLLEEFPNSVITRAHYAKYMLNHGYIKSIKEAFERYVGDNCPYFVPREKVTPAQAVELILNAGGIPILAHPVLYRMSNARLELLTAKLKEAGLMGLEAIYSTYCAAEERQIRRLAKKYNLLISGGSDFHGSNKPGLDLGVGYGKLYVPNQVLDDIKAALAKRH